MNVPLDFCCNDRISTLPVFFASSKMQEHALSFIFIYCSQEQMLFVSNAKGWKNTTIISLCFLLHVHCTRWSASCNPSFFIIHKQYLKLT